MKAKKKLPIYDIFFLWVNYAFLLALLISYLAPITDPRKFWIIAFFGLAYPILLLVNFLLALYWALRKKWLFLLSATGILCGWGVLHKNIGFHYAAPVSYAQNSGLVRIMTYNVHNFKKFGSNKDISTKHEILNLIAEQRPDVIGFQEYYTRKKGQYDMTDSIKKIMASENYYIENFEGNNEETIGMAIFSKYPIINKGLVPFTAKPYKANECLYLDIKKDDRIFRVYTVHLQSINFEPQDYKYLDTVSKGTPDVHSTLRVGDKLKKAFLKRAEQVFKVKADAATCPYPYIISGDFNDTPTSFVVNQMSKGLKNAFVEKAFGLGRTYNGNFPNYQIDYVFASQQFNIRSYHIIEKKLSDHYPVVSDVMLR